MRSSGRSCECPSAAEECVFGRQIGGFDEDGAFTRCERGHAIERGSAAEGGGVVVNLPTSDVDGVGGDVGDLKPVSSHSGTAIGPGGDFGDDDDRCGWCLRFHIADGEGEIHTDIRCAADSGVIGIHGHGVAALRLEIEGNTGFEEELGSGEFKGGRIGSAKAQGVRAEAVIGDNDVSEFHAGGGAAAFWQRRGGVIHDNRRRSCIWLRGRRIYPELRVIDASATVFIDDIKNARTIHRDAFMLLTGRRERIARIATDVQRAGDDTTAVHIDDACVFLTENDEIARLRLAIRRGQIGKREDIRRVRHAQQSRIEEVRGVHRGGRAICGGACSEVHAGLEDADRRQFLQADEAARLRIPRETFRACVIDEGADFHRLRSAAAQCCAGGVGEFHELAITLFAHDKLTAADISEALGIIEISALWTTAEGERHRVDELTSLGNLSNGTATIARDEERIGVPIVSHRRGFLTEEIMNRCA